MSLFSRLLSTPVRILNIPIKVAAKTLDAVADPRGYLMVRRARARMKRRMALRAAEQANPKDKP